MKHFYGVFPKGIRILRAERQRRLKETNFCDDINLKRYFLLLSLSLHAARRMGESMQNRISIRSAPVLLR